MVGEGNDSLRLDFKLNGEPMILSQEEHREKHEFSGQSALDLGSSVGEEEEDLGEREDSVFWEKVRQENENLQQAGNN